MQTQLQVSVVTPVQSLVTDTFTQVVAPSVCGQVTILPQHTPLLCNLAAGVVQLGPAAAAQRYFVSGGFMEVAHDRVSILAESAQRTSEINVAEAQTALRAAQAQLLPLQPQDATYESTVRLVDELQQKIAATK
jgi:F-type H+-transporting ATPase subunit epsilon